MAVVGVPERPFDDATVAFPMEVEELFLSKPKL
jgi:hypothetical protein